MAKKIRSWVATDQQAGSIHLARYLEDLLYDYTFTKIPSP
ncbi:MAG: hypothetical protein K0S33_206 [Bacteroidetes bacterium]|jgi:hypothetical protein|nr:hypothetical protein [Bacteroidota bacterium]